MREFRRDICKHAAKRTILLGSLVGVRVWVYWTPDCLDANDFNHSAVALIYEY
jgi:hypothetical protein